MSFNNIVLLRKNIEVSAFKALLMNVGSVLLHEDESGGVLVCVQFYLSLCLSITLFTTFLAPLCPSKVGTWLDVEMLIFVDHPFNLHRAMCWQHLSKLWIMDVCLYQRSGIGKSLKYIFFFTYSFKSCSWFCKRGEWCINTIDNRYKSKWKSVTIKDYIFDVLCKYRFLKIHFVYTNYCLLG